MTEGQLWAPYVCSFHPLFDHARKLLFCHFTGDLTEAQGPECLTKRRSLISVLSPSVR